MMKPTEEELAEDRPKTSTERGREYAKKNNGASGHRKYGQLHREAWALFNLKRSIRPPFVPIPESIDQNSALFKRVKKRYEKELSQRVEVKV